MSCSREEYFGTFLLFSASFGRDQACLHVPNLCDYLHASALQWNGKYQVAFILLLWSNFADKTENMVVKHSRVALLSGLCLPLNQE